MADHASPKKKTVSFWLSQLLLGLVGVIIALALLEFAVRLLPPPKSQFTTYGDTYICSPTLGWLGRPNYQGVITREEYSHPIRFNSQGIAGGN